MGNGEQEKTIAKVKVNGKGSPMIAVGGYSFSLIAIIGLIVWAVNVIGQVEDNADGLKKNDDAHKMIYATLHAMEIDNNTVKTLQKERHTEVTKRLDRLEQKLDALIDANK